MRLIATASLVHCLLAGDVSGDGRPRGKMDLARYGGAGSRALALRRTHSRLHSS